MAKCPQENKNDGDSGGDGGVGGAGLVGVVGIVVVVSDGDTYRNCPSRRC